MNKSKKEQRKLNKLNKKRAFIRLVKMSAEEGELEDDSPFHSSDEKESKVTDHAVAANGSDHLKMIAALEADIGSRPVTKREHSPFCDDLDEPQTDQEYRLIMKKRKRSQQLEMYKEYTTIYVDQYFLSISRSKFLGYNVSNPNSIDLSERIMLRINDIQHLISYILLLKRSMYRPRWCQIRFAASVTKLLLVVIHNVSYIDALISQPSCWSRLLSIHNKPLDFVSPQFTGSEIMSDLLMIPLNYREKSTRIKSFKQTETSEDGNQQKVGESKNDEQMILNLNIHKHKDAFPRTSLLLTCHDLQTEGFPLPLPACKKDYSDFVYTHSDYSALTESSPLYSIDCEMVRSVHDQLELASVCLVNEKLEIVYETLVKPANKVKDYLTKYSGMTAKKLKPVTTKLSDVQNKLRQLLPRDAIICGQSVNSDLTALKMFHPFIIDTTVIYNLKGMPHSKTALKTLSQIFLRKTIQDGSEGHCPAEDAITAMQLVLLKLQNDYSFGNVMADGLMSTPDRFFVKKSELENPVSPSSNGVEQSEEVKLGVSVSCEKSFNRRIIPQLEVNCLDLLASHDKSAHYSTTNLSVQTCNDSTTVSECKNNKKVAKSTISALKSAEQDFYISEFEFDRDENSTSESRKKNFSRLDRYVGDLYDSLPDHSMMITVLEGSQHQPGALLYNIKHAADTNHSTNYDMTASTTGGTAHSSYAEDYGDIYGLVYSS